MKWTIQIMVMAGDIGLLIAAIVITIFAIKSSSLFVAVISLVVVLAAYNTWKSQGGLIAWKERKQFMHNWEEMRRRKP